MIAPMLVCTAYIKRFRTYICIFFIKINAGFFEMPLYIMQKSASVYKMFGQTHYRTIAHKVLDDCPGCQGFPAFQ